MTVDRTLLKKDARERMGRYKPNPILVGLVVFLLSWVLQYLMLSVLGLNFEIRVSGRSFMTIQDVLHFMDEMQKEILAHFHPSVFAVLLAVALVIMNIMVDIGHIIYALHVTREEKADYGNLLDGFSVFGRVIVLTLVQALIIYAGLILFVVPGIIAFYSLRQSMYLLLDHPDRSPFECLRASNVLMSGHRMELLVLDLSFLGWMLLQSIFAPLAILIRPYQTLTYANYYRTLRGEAVPAPKGKQFFEGQYTDIPSDDDDSDDWNSLS